VVVVVNSLVSGVDSNVEALGSAGVVWNAPA
jgi:hypothetical protein